MDPTTFRLMSGATAPPVEITFTTNNYNPEANGTSTLSWSVLNSTSVSINEGIGSVADSGSIGQSGIGVTRTYTLTAMGINGITYTSSITISWGASAGSAVEITFTSNTYSPGMSEGVVLTWSVLNSTSVSINHVGSVASAGSIALGSEPFGTQTITFTLTALNSVGTAYYSSITVTFNHCGGRVWRGICLW